MLEALYKHNQQYLHLIVEPHDQLIKQLQLNMDSSLK